jgi:hypothetical protein
MRVVKGITTKGVTSWTRDCFWVTPAATRMSRWDEDTYDHMDDRWALCLENNCCSTAANRSICRPTRMNATCPVPNLKVLKHACPAAEVDGSQQTTKQESALAPYSHEPQKRRTA